MRAIIKKWGNSAAIRLPSTLLAEARLEVEDAVDVTGDEGCIVIQSVKRPLTLDSLLSSITPENRHEPQDFGAAVGKETL